MNGQVRSYDEYTGRGSIVETGVSPEVRYAFTKDDWPDESGIAVGTRVEFETGTDARAKNIRLLGPTLSSG